MASDALRKYGTLTAFTATGLASLANNASIQTTLVSNTTTRFTGLRITASIHLNTTAASANSYVTLWAIRGDGTTRSDNAASGTGSLTAKNARKIGDLFTGTSAPASGEFLTELFDWPWEDVGAEFGVIVLNASGQALNASGSVLSYQGWTTEAQ